MPLLPSTLLPYRRQTLLTLSASATAAALALSYVLTNPAARTMASTSSSSTPFPVRSYTPSHKAFPYTTSDLTPSDPSSDAAFYSSPRFVTHIDDHAIGVLRRYYGSILPTPVTSGSSSSSTTARRPRVLDLCSSWISHYPTSLEDAAERGEDTGMDIGGTGMSASELVGNTLFGGKQKPGRVKRWVVKDMNVDPTMPPLNELYPSTTAVATDAQDPEGELIDVSTLTVSIDYLTRPVAVLSSLLKHTRSGGTVHLAISNRCFPTKAVSRWLRISEEQRLEMVGDYLWFAGWRDVEIVTLSTGQIEEEQGQEVRGVEQDSNVARFMAMMGLGGSGRVDPLWVVRARKVDEEIGKEKEKI